MDILQLLAQAKAAGASDLHLSVNAPPVLRVNGELVAEGDPLSPADTEGMARALMTSPQWEAFAAAGEIDFSFSLPGVSRYRVNVYRQRGCVSIAARVVPNQVPKLEDLGLPEVLRSFTDKPNGLVLVTGPTGSGKSTTLAAMIDHINHTQRKHIITLEDPIEYLHRHHLSIINQREIGLDTHGFGPALRAALRQDPDVILVGEMRDLETMQTAITAAETGHLVFATLHTSDAVQTVDRMIDVFPASQQAQVRLQIASVLQGVVTQRLYKRADGRGRVAAVEVLVNTPAVANLIRTEKTHQIRSVMQTGRAFGMQTMEMHLRELVGRGVVPASALQLAGVLGAGVL
ncbi:MAG: type IV pilus twitching motility protein PilT [Alicyclobacillus macrosporangiidus]|uniref:type IV pilus twitching motility protein PilT n=1 Tax=Alicyclobacillus macrosporangiidus TaxID=392015 RepID=UPI0026E9C53C|nr:type IV pilus twitching motility protein PilT [Alicyclobacillus macrosporangiidus]MCL6598565.1 type IV pilus twitching motility protein PilT [Alicyclobacillus macrosporangiidus]